MLTYYLSEEHLAHSDHTAPSSITDIRTVYLIGQFGETWTVGEPGSGSKYFENLLSDLGEVSLLGVKRVSKDVYLISLLKKGGFLIFFEVAEEVVPEIKSEVLDAFSEGRLSKGHVNNYKK